MTYDKIDSNNSTEYHKIILLLKTTGLIKDKSQQYQNYNNLGEFYHE